MTNPAKQKQAIEFFCRQGWSLAQSCGLVANLIAESNLNEAAVGDGGQAYGIAQHHPPRQRDFAAIIGKDIRDSTYEEQLAFVHSELQRGEARAGDALRDCQSAADAAVVVCRLYERPADKEGESIKRAKLAERIYAEYAQSPQTAPEQPTPAPAGPEVSTPPKPSKEPLMGALAFLPTILGMIPQLAPLFGKSGEKATQYAGVAQQVVDAFTKSVPGAVNAQQAVEMASADAAVKAQAIQTTLADPAVAMLLEVGGGIPAARKNAAEAAANPDWYRPLLTPAFVVSVLLLVIASAILADVLYVHPTAWTGSDRSQVLILCVAIISGVMGYYIGSSLSSTRKDDALAGRP